MKICRIQDSKGRGPWKPGFSHKWIETRDDHDNLLPSYVEFRGADLSLIGCEKKIVCGCTSVDQLKRWFSEKEYGKLMKFGYRAVWMEAQRAIAQSETQGLFAIKKKATKKTVCFRLY